MKGYVAVSGFLLLITTQSQVLIDDFNAGDFSLNGPGSVISTAPGHVIGDSRTVSINGSTFPPVSSASLNSANGYLEYARNSDDFFFKLSYTTSSSTPWNFWSPTGGGIELSLDVQSNDPAMVTLALYTAFPDNHGSTSARIANFPLPPSGLLSVPFTALGVPNGVSYANFYGNIFQVYLYIGQSSPLNGFTGYNGPGTYRFNDLVVVPVPEPDKLAALCAGALSIFAVWRTVRGNRSKSYARP